MRIGRRGIGDDGLTERRVGRREHDREHERLEPGQRGEEQGGNHRARGDRQRQPDSEQACRQRDLTPQRSEIDPRRVREEDERQRRLGERAHGAALDPEVEPAEHLRPNQEAGGHEQHRRSEHRPLEPPRQPRIAEHQRRDDRQAPAVHLLRSSATAPPERLLRRSRASLATAIAQRPPVAPRLPIP